MIIEFSASDAGRYLHQSETLEILERSTGDVTLRVGATVTWTPTVVTVVAEFIRRSRLRGSHVVVEASPIKAATLRRLGFGRIASIIPLLPTPAAPARPIAVVATATASLA